MESRSFVRRTSRRPAPPVVAPPRDGNKGKIRGMEKGREMGKNGSGLKRFGGEMWDI